MPEIHHGDVKPLLFYLFIYYYYLPLLVLLLFISHRHAVCTENKFHKSMN